MRNNISSEKFNSDGCGTRTCTALGIWWWRREWGNVARANQARDNIYSRWGRVGRGKEHAVYYNWVPFFLVYVGPLNVPVEQLTLKDCRGKKKKKRETSDTNNPTVNVRVWWAYHYEALQKQKKKGWTKYFLKMEEEVLTIFFLKAKSNC